MYADILIIGIRFSCFSDDLLLLSNHCVSRCKLSSVLPERWERGKDHRPDHGFAGTSMPDIYSFSLNILVTSFLISLMYTISVMSCYIYLTILYLHAR